MAKTGWLISLSRRLSLDEKQQFSEQLKPLAKRLNYMDSAVTPIPLVITNDQFLTSIFGEMHIYAHVTSFAHDPGNIPAGEHMRAWAGGIYKDTPINPGNQFYTVSLFAPEEGKFRRRKAQFSATYVIGLDDVKEKLPLDQVQRLPPPSIVIKTSLHSEQWLYILQVPETNRSRVDNLQDGLIQRGLAPDGVDPGQRGVTRYLRLPEGVNTKAKRIAENNGTAHQCNVTVFGPSRRYTMEELAAPFDINLNATRRDARTDGASAIDDHPMLHSPALTIKSTLSAGRYDVTCPWVDEHTDSEDNGSAIFTNKDNSIGFHCHHGNCEGRSGNNLLRKLEENDPGFNDSLRSFQQQHLFSNVPGLMAPVAAVEPEVSFMTPVVTVESIVAYPLQKKLASCTQ